MMMLEMARVLGSPDGIRLVATLRRLVRSQGLPVDQVVRNSVEHIERLEKLAQLNGKTVKQVADEAMALYEAKEGGAA
ncbi:hypothetical protein LCGC14_1452860 [marine sediment metagenome]|uniref:Uncharacterized protein n=1 Tax=marine sediment metagenome TaxID=412755 RepID=A0A0F9K3P6_9ZZZZ